MTDRLSICLARQHAFARAGFRLDEFRLAR